ncbi:syntaxin-binding protein 4-like isoform X2 [Ostrea edulis]|uniref:syntaxin-binding protein 4-like isoform X2 n=1 Tax=Ostrea edulis TaxID=37623 RepID=UPI00209578BA|nr:syntaxin-binding protein 4-like isoform X2 [Ostrea edulis]
MSSTVVLTQDEHHAPLAEENESEEYREAELIAFDNCFKGVGIKICGGCSRDGREVNGIFIKRILPGGLADQDGRLQQGDEILSVNGESFQGITNDRAVAILRQASASNQVEMAVARDEQSKAEFLEILEKQNGASFPCTPVPMESQGKKEISNPVMVNGSSGHDSNSPRYLSETSPQELRIEEIVQHHRNNQDHVVPESFSSIREHHQPHLTPNGRHLIPSMTSTPHNEGGKVTNNLPPLYSMDHSPVLGSMTTTSDPFTSVTSTESSRYQNMSKSRKLSLDPTVRLKIEKLEVALRYLGLEPSEEQDVCLREQLKVDSSGTVNYGDFVAVVRDVFKEELQKKKIDPRAMLFAANDIKDFVEPPPFRHIENHFHSFIDENSEFIQERDVLHLEVQRLRESEIAKCRAEGELHNIQLKAQGAMKKVEIAERAQREARNVEKDYEEVVQLLEAEVAKLKEERKANVTNNADSQQQMAVFSCQLKKLESEKKTYEVATEKLLQFAENVHETMMSQGNSVGLKKGDPARGNRPPAYLGRHKQFNPKTIAAEAKEVVSAVRSIIEKDPLPYGWEEAYTADGMRYYINHVTQTTTWSHPKTGVQHITSSLDCKPVADRKFSA